MVVCIVRMLLEELFLLLDCLIQIVKDKLEWVLILYLSSPISCEYFLHNLIKEVVAEVSHSYSAWFLYKILGNRKEISRLEIAQYKVAFKDSNNK